MVAPSHRSASRSPWFKGNQVAVAPEAALVEAVAVAVVPAVAETAALVAVEAVVVALVVAAVVGTGSG